jgi:hypothetical protein
MVTRYSGKHNIPYSSESDAFSTVIYIGITERQALTLEVQPALQDAEVSDLVDSSKFILMRTLREKQDDNKTKANNPKAA